jgi:hypothetical protein
MSRGSAGTAYPGAERCPRRRPQAGRQLGVRPGTIQYTSMYAKTPLPGPAVESCLVQGLRHHRAHVSDPWLRTLDP